MHPVATTGTRPFFPMRAVMTSRTDGVTIGELSRLTGVHIETIRYYERIKMLPKPPRTAGGRRTYSSTHVRQLAFIKRSRELGFSPDDVRKLLRLGGPEKAPCRQVRDVALSHLNDIRAKITDLRKLERLWAKTVAKCTGTTAPECPVLDILDVQGEKQALNG
jgi:MerR family mercuric resistance operon transcriptional regulator